MISNSYNECATLANQSLQNIKNSLCEKIQKVDLLKHPYIFKYVTSKVVIGYGNILSKNLILGEAPGYWENVEEKPFVGRSGKLLQEIFTKLNFDQINCTYISNVIMCRPIDNQTPTKEDLLYFSSYTKMLVDLVKPDNILVLGKVAKTFFKEYFTLEMIPKIVIFAYHPSFLLRNPNNQKIKKDFFDQVSLFCQAATRMC